VHIVKTVALRVIEKIFLINIKKIAFSLIQPEERFSKAFRDFVQLFYISMYTFCVLENL
jgi:hypothetical protein